MKMKMNNHIFAVWKLKAMGFLVKLERKPNGNFSYYIKRPGSKHGFFLEKPTLVNYCKMQEKVKKREKIRCSTDIN